MPAIGITGGIATGKSVLCAELRRLLPEATFFDADVAARELTASDREVQELLREAFGPEIYSAAGDLNRAQLRTIVFADPEKKLALEQILHPRIRRQWAAPAASRHGPTELFLADIPLLYETGGEILCDAVVVVACSHALQLQRLMMRSSLNQAAAEQIVAGQMPLAEKMARANHVVWNNGPRAVLNAQAELLAAAWTRA